MYKVKETSLEWALLHVTNYYDSDFFPRLFEFEAIKRNWTNIKTYLLSLDLKTHTPKSPVISLALKPNGNYRVVHQLDPIDSIIYTALLYECAETIELYRVPEMRRIACSYRIRPDLNGSFFDPANNGYSDFIDKAEDLCKTFEEGCVLVCDIVDFYNQIYLHRVNNILDEAGVETANIIESFLSNLNTNISRGVPVGPAPSILIAEAVLSDIDKKIISYTHSFTRYVDDFYIFFETVDEASVFLHELTRYLYSNHRLVLSSEKTELLPVKKFRNKYIKDEDRIERKAIHSKLEDMNISKYNLVEKVKDFDELDDPKKMKIRAQVYEDLFIQALDFDIINVGLLRHLLRQAGRYRIRNLIPHIFEDMDRLLPVIREVVLYFDKVISEKTVLGYQHEFKKLLANPYLDLPYINIWIFTLFQNQLFNLISLEIDYGKIQRNREKALIARRERNLTWLKDIKDGLDTLGPWDRRAVIYASSILSKDEVVHWLSLEASKGDILNKALCSMVINDKKTEK